MKNNIREFTDYRYVNNLFTWDSLSRIGQLKVMNLTILIPFIGYMILFNENIVQLLELSKEVHSFTIDNISRLFYFYYGLSSLGIGSLIYQLKCPVLIKEYDSQNIYAKEESAFLTKRRISSITREIRRLRSTLHPIAEKVIGIASGEDSSQGYKEIEPAKIDLLIIHWREVNRSHKLARFGIFHLYLVGFIILLIPSIEMFINLSRIAFLN